jgi:hypothetical protein
MRLPRAVSAWALPLAAVATAAVITPTSASAADGTYSVSACRTATGAPAARVNWEPSATPATSATDDCSTGGGLRLTLGPNPPGSAGAAWTFTAPPDTRIVRVRADRATSGFESVPENSYWAYSFGPVGSRAFEACDKKDGGCPGNFSAPLDAAGLDAQQVKLALFCAHGPDPCLNTSPVSVALSRAVVALKDETRPTVALAGPVDEGATSGVLRVRFNATDAGGGLYRATTLVDGKPFATQPLGDGACADADPTNADPYEFLSPTPCPLSVAGREAALDYRQLPAGPHTVVTEVEDAAGNTTAVHSTQFPKINDVVGADPQRVLSARLKAWFPKGKNGRVHARSSTVKRGTRPLIRGIVVDKKGKGIEGAQVDIYHRLGNGKRRLLKTGVKTRKGGRLTYIVSANVDTRRIELAYRALRPGKITSRQTLRVRVTHKGRTYYMPANRPRAK